MKILSKKIVLDWEGRQYAADLSQPLDISTAITPGEQGVNCFFAPWPEAWPVEAGSFIGDTRKGGTVNFFNLRLNPHGNGAHTECVGHIALERVSIHDSLRQFHFFAKLISLYPRRLDTGDRIILLEDLRELLAPGEAEALVLRTLPNDDLKRTANYSGSNPPYIAEEAMRYLVDCGIEHLLVDLPSVDREEDGGKLAAHKVFWQYPGHQVRTHCTITELIYVPSVVADGFYLLNIQIPSLHLDASPSKPVLYALQEAP